MTYRRAEALFDWQAYIEQQGGLSASRRGSEYLLRCDSCGKEKLAVNAQKRRWRCFTCGTGGRCAASLIAQAEGLMWHQAVLAVMTGQREVIGSVDEISVALKVPERERPANWIPKGRTYPDGWESLPGVSQTAVRGENYCAERGIFPGVIRAMQIGVCNHGRFSGRLMFPVFDAAGRLIFYQGRAMWAPEPGHQGRFIKTLSPKLDEEGLYAGASDVLLGLTTVARMGFSRVLVVEGPIDCAHAMPDAVASFGKHLSPRQVELLMRAGVTAIDLCYDADAMETTMKQAPALADLFEVRIVQLPPGHDPGDLTKTAIEHYRKDALTWGTGDRLGHLTGSLV